jgi:hypothetical protein
MRPRVRSARRVAAISCRLTRARQARACRVSSAARRRGPDLPLQRRQRRRPGRAASSELPSPSNRTRHARVARSGSSRFCARQAWFPHRPPPPPTMCTAPPLRCASRCGPRLTARTADGRAWCAWHGQQTQQPDAVQPLASGRDAALRAAARLGACACALRGGPSSCCATRPQRVNAPPTGPEAKVHHAMCSVDVPFLAAIESARPGAQAPSSSPAYAAISCRHVRLVCHLPAPWAGQGQASQRRRLQAAQVAVSGLRRRRHLPLRVLRPVRGRARSGRRGAAAPAAPRASRVAGASGGLSTLLLADCPGRRAARRRAGCSARRRCRAGRQLGRGPVSASLQAQALLTECAVLRPTNADPIDCCTRGWMPATRTQGVLYNEWHATATSLG